MAMIKSLQTINAGEGVEKKKPSYIVGGNANLCSHYGKQYGDFLKTKNRVAIWSSNPNPGHISRENHKRDIHSPFHCSTIYNSEDMGAT